MSFWLNGLFHSHPVRISFDPSSPQSTVSTAFVGQHANMPMTVRSQNAVASITLRGPLVVPTRGGYFTTSLLMTASSHRWDVILGRDWFEAVQLVPRQYEEGLPDPPASLAQSDTVTWTVTSADVAGPFLILSRNEVPSSAKDATASLRPSQADATVSVVDTGPVPVVPWNPEPLPAPVVPWKSAPLFRVQPSRTVNETSTFTSTFSVATQPVEPFREVDEFLRLSRVGVMTEVELREVMCIHSLEPDFEAERRHEGCQRLCDVVTLPEDDTEARSLFRCHILRTIRDQLKIQDMRALMSGIGVVFAIGEPIRKLRSKITQYISSSRDVEQDASRRQQRVERARQRHNSLEERKQALRASWPVVQSNERKEELIQNFRLRTSSKALARVVCACCSEQIFRTSATSMPFSEIPLELLQPPSQLQHVPIMHEIPQILQPALLHPEGINDSEESIHLCLDCHSALKRDKLPALAMANHTYAGAVPSELKDLTPVEEALIARARAKAWIVHLRFDGDNVNGTVLPNMQRGLRGHTVIYPQRPGRLLDVLPPPIDDIMSMVCVVFVGSRPPDKQWLLNRAKPLAVNKNKVWKALTWLKAHNPLYHNVTIDQNIINSLPEQGTLPFAVSEISESDAQRAATARYDGSSQFHDERGGQSEDYDNVYQRVVIADVHGNSPSSELRAAALRHFKDKGGGYLEVPHDPLPVNEFFHPELFPYVYPTLFPYGVGGFEDHAPPALPVRRVSLSLKRHVKHLLMSIDDRFRTHPSFMFVVFNILQRREVLLRASLKTKRSSFLHVAQELSAISSQSIKQVCQKIEAGQRTGDNDEERRVFSLMKQVNLVSVNVPGSPASRVKMRNEVRAMMIEYGLPSFYITVNPADVYNPVVRFLSGEDIDIDDLPDSDEDPYWRQSILIAKNPVLGAQFFNLYMNAFIECLLVSDKNLEGKGGVLGHVKAHFGAVEAQGRGSLHCHMVVWVEGALNPNQIRERVLGADSEDFKRRLVEFVDDIISTSVPEPDICCNDHDEHGHSSKNPCSHRGPKMDISDLPEDLLAIVRKRDLIDIVRACQVHKHTATCYKYCKAGETPVCRFDLDPANTREYTDFDPESGELCLRCLDGMVNNFNAVIIRAIRCNMDLKMIASGDTAKAILYYITDYITKTPLKAHVAYAALEVAVSRLERDIASDNDIFSIHAKKMLQKCALFMITHQEMSGQQVASSLLDLPDKFCSEEFVNLYWVPFERYMESQSPSPECYSQDVSDPASGSQSDAVHAAQRTLEERDDSDEEESLDGDEESSDDELDVILETDRDGNVVRKGTQLLDYIHRGTIFDDLSVWQFVSRTHKISGTSGDFVRTLSLEDFLLDDSRNRPTGGFSSLHPEADRKILELSTPVARKIPVPIGPALPRRDREDYVKHKYCRIMLVLFKPWRCISDLRASGQSWIEAFDEFVTGIGDNVHNLLDNMQIIHECKDCRDDHIRNRAHHSSRRIIADEFTRASRQEVDDDLVDEMEESDVLDHLMSIERGESSHLSRARALTEDCVQAALENGLYSIPLQAARDSTVISEPVHTTAVDIDDVSQELIWKAEYTKRKKAWKLKLAEDDSSAPVESHASHAVQRGMVQSLASAAASEPQVRIVPQAKPVLDQNVSSADVIRKWTLNEEQALAFSVVIDHINGTNTKPLRMFLGGAGGTGKSTVISALKDYFERRGQSRRFRLASFTGVAARNIGGTTLHAALNLQQRHQATKKGSTANEELVSMWEGVDFLFIDEVSMVGCRLLAYVSRALSMAKGNETPFGGINIIFAGDFAQLPCVREVRLYADLDFSRQAEDTVFGKLLWLSVDTVVMLKQQMRQSGAGNIRFVELLTRLRDGQCTREDYDLLQPRILKHCRHLVSNGQWADAPTIVTDNATKDQLNREAVLAFSRKTSRAVQWYHSKDVFRQNTIEKGKLKDLLEEQPSGVTEQRLGRIPLVEGMKVIVAQNHDVTGGIVNGSIGSLKGLRYYMDKDNNRILKSCIVEISDGSFANMDGLSEGEAPILPDTKKFTIKHRFSGHTAKIARTQVPLQPGYAFTAHRAQGQSYDQVVVDLQGSDSIESAYVMLSRATSLDAVIILRPFEFARIVAKKDTARLKEERRLRILELQTLVRVMPHTEKAKQAQLDLSEMTQPYHREDVDIAVTKENLLDAAQRIKRVIATVASPEDNVNADNKRRRV